jgi:putative ABC transport system permease protein
MTRFNLILRNLIYYRRFHIWTLLGTVLGTAILTGALVTGDSVRYSLRQIVFDRLGNTQFAMMSGDRFISPSVADKLSKKLDIPAAPLLLTRG